MIVVCKAIANQTHLANSQIDYVGQRFHDATILTQAPNISGRRYIVVYYMTILNCSNFTWCSLDTYATHAVGIQVLTEGKI